MSATRDLKDEVSQFKKDATFIRRKLMQAASKLNPDNSEESGKLDRCGEARKNINALEAKITSNPKLTEEQLQDANTELSVYRELAEEIIRTHVPDVEAEAVSGPRFGF